MHLRVHVGVHMHAGVCIIWYGLCKKVKVNNTSVTTVIYIYCWGVGGGAVK